MLTHHKHFILLAGSAFVLLLGVFSSLHAAANSPLSSQVIATFSGRVYEGEVGDETTPLEGVTVELYGANGPYPNPGEFIRNTTTDSAGWYGLSITDDDPPNEYYSIREIDPYGFYSVGATSVDGIVRTSNWIEYFIPLEGKTLTGNKFWDMLITTNTPTRTGTTTPTPTGTGTTTPTLTGTGTTTPTLTGTVTTTPTLTGTATTTPTLTGTGTTTPNPTRTATTTPVLTRTPTPSATLTATPASSAADLVITDIWPEGNNICFQEQNIGQEVAPADHIVALLVHSELRDILSVPINLIPGGRWNRCFPLNWTCSPPDDLIAVVADYNNDIRESDETNNTRAEAWACDIIPPIFVVAPHVIDITINSANVEWETNESTEGIVRYGQIAGNYLFEKATGVFQTKNSLTLTNLEAATTYHLMVDIFDDSGNRSTSREVNFTTLPMPDDEDPYVSLLDMSYVYSGTVGISAEGIDNIGMEKIEFYIDGTLVFIDYSPPYQFELVTILYENGEHTIGAKGYDISGRIFLDERVIKFSNPIDERAPVAIITSPSDGANVSGKVTVQVELSDDLGLAYAFFYIDGVGQEYDNFYPDYPTSEIVTFTWDTTEVADGSHRIGAVVYDIETKQGIGTIDVSVNQPPTPAPPNLIVTKHEVTRLQNYFLVTLTIANIGAGKATNVVIQDSFQPFQATSRSVSGGVDKYTAMYIESSMWGYCVMESAVDIASKGASGDTRTFTYALLPVLIYPSPPSASIGDDVYLDYDGTDGKSYSKQVKALVPQTSTGELIQDAYWDALQRADYLIVTNPQRLGWYNLSTSDNDALLADMAQLAYYKNGALGYLYTNSNTTLRGLLAPSGTWASMLYSGYSTTVGTGYLLLVGESDIIPTWNIQQPKLCPANPTSCPIHHSDQPYADVYGNDDRPELIVGRIIGNTSAKLANVIKTSLGIYEGTSGYGFDRSEALSVGGGNPNEATWESDAKTIANILDDEFTTYKVIWNWYKNDAMMNLMFKSQVKDIDVIYYTGHGHVDTWYGVITVGQVDGRKYQFPVDFGSTNPFIFASACRTGNYDPTYYSGSPYPNYGIAEAFFDSGASVYIGSTVVYKNFLEADKQFFNNWVKTTKSIGSAFLETECNLLDNYGDAAKTWTEEFNLYGDPKIGSYTSTDATSNPNQTYALEVPPSSIDVIVPDYVVTTTNGLDEVEIPGGLLMSEVDQPHVPFYSIHLVYPSGYEVQDVTLTGKSGVTETIGLNLPIFRSIEKNTSEGKQVAEIPEGWYPSQEYGWSMVKNPDGTIDLTIILYPFSYNCLTTNAKFYKNYSFAIHYITTPAVITSLTTDKDLYQLGEVVTTDLMLNQPGDVSNLIVNATIKSFSAREVVAGLPLRTLQGLTGLASYSIPWNSIGLDPGYYYVDTILQDTNGNIIDQQTKLFKLGIPAGEITSLTASQQTFDIGDSLAISMTFVNTGTLTITGTATIRVQAASGEIIQEFQHDFSVAPNNAIFFNDLWDTVGIKRGAYRIIGTVVFDDWIFDPKFVDVSSSYPVYLPIISKKNP